MKKFLVLLLLTLLGLTKAGPVVYKPIRTYSAPIYGYNPYPPVAVLPPVLPPVGSPYVYVPRSGPPPDPTDD